MASIEKSQSFLNRDFESIRQDLLDILKTHFPDQWQDFNSTSIGMSLVDLMSFVSDNLSYYTDKKFNEQFLDGVTERSSVFRLAKTFGYKPAGFRPAITLTDINIEVPPTSTGPDLSYLPIYRAGFQIKGGGQIFETTSDADFSSDFSDDGTSNRKIIPLFNANQDIIKYRITKREKAKAGTTTIFSREISLEDALTPFFEITLPENNVLEIISIIAKPGTGLKIQPTFSDFSDNNIRYYEVDELANAKVFIVDETQSSSNGIKVGTYLDVNQRFIKEFMADGSCKITFGGGQSDVNAYENYLSKIPIGDTNKIKIKDVLDNTALGSRLPVNTTLYIKYRIGGGTLSNVGSNILQQVGNINAVILGTNSTLNQNVINSTTASNVLPAVGGADLQSVDEIKHSVASNFASQKRCITLNDYITRSFQLPGKFGAPFRIHGKTEDNKIKLYILSKDATGKVMTTSTSTIKNNLVEYLIPFRSINDFVEINDGKVINLQIEVDLFVNKTFNINEVKTSVLTAIKDYFNIDKWQMNQNIYISQISDMISKISGIINVVDIRFYNLEGGNYSNTLISQATGQREQLSNSSTFRTRIDYINNAIFSTQLSIFEVRIPNSDILLRVS